MSLRMLPGIVKHRLRVEANQAGFLVRFIDWHPVTLNGDLEGVAEALW